MTIGFSTRAISAPVGAALRNRFGKEPVNYVPLSQFFTSKKSKDGEDDDALYGRRARPRTRKKAKAEKEGAEGAQERAKSDTDDETRRTKKPTRGGKQTQEDTKDGQPGAHSEMTLSTNIATTSVPIGAGDGRKFLSYGPGHPHHGRDFDDEKKKRKKKRKSLSKRLSYLLTIP